MENNMSIKTNFAKYLEDNHEKVISSELTLDQFKNDLIKMNIFTEEKDCLLFIVEQLINDFEAFEIQFPIKYYVSEGEYENDSYQVDDSDIEHLNEEYVEKMTSTD